jgi:hypothetical protein
MTRALERLNQVSESGDGGRVGVGCVGGVCVLCLVLCGCPPWFGSATTRARDHHHPHPIRHVSSPPLHPHDDEQIVKEVAAKLAKHSDGSLPTFQARPSLSSPLLSSLLPCLALPCVCSSCSCLLVLPLSLSLVFPRLAFVLPVCSRSALLCSALLCSALSVCFPPQPPLLTNAKPSNQSTGDARNADGPWVPGRPDTG